MATTEDIGRSPYDGLPIHPSYLLLASYGAAVALVATSYLTVSLPAVVFLLLGLLAAAGAVILQPRSPSVLVGAGLAAALVAWGMKSEWDSARSVVIILAFLAFLAAFLVALPDGMGWLLVRLGDAGRQSETLQQRGQAVGRFLSKALLSLLVVVHFSGIASAVLSVASPNRDGSWLAQGVWSLLQPYLQFCYLTNAYRFYSPEPGPPSLLWFHIEYADGSTRWVKLPGRKKDYDPMGQEYTRRLSIAESVNQLEMMQFIPDHVRHKRWVAGRNADIPLLNLDQIDTPEIPTVDLQRRVPNEASQQLLSEFARYAAHNYPSEKNPSAEVVGIKIYRVIHRILDPRELADPSSDPTDPTTYWPYFQGEFTKDGRLKDPEDPFLYWLIPIYRQPRVRVVDPVKGPSAPPLASPGGYMVRDCLAIHAQLKTKQGGN